MILKEELIKHKWKYVPESHSWEKLGVTFRDVDRALNNYSLRFAATLRSGIHTFTLSDLEHYIKRCVSIIFCNKRFHSRLSIKQKRTLKNWIL